MLKHRQIIKIDMEGWPACWSQFNGEGGKPIALLYNNSYHKI